MRPDYETLCPGIRQTVRWLNDRGFDTTDSGDGYSNEGMEGAMPFPNVMIRVPVESLISETHRLYDLLKLEGIEPGPMGPDPAEDPPYIEASYDPSTGVAFILLLNLDDKLLFRSKTHAD